MARFTRFKALTAGAAQLREAFQTLQAEYKVYTAAAKADVIGVLCGDAFVSETCSTTACTVQLHNAVSDSPGIESS